MGGIPCVCDGIEYSCDFVNPNPFPKNLDVIELNPVSNVWQLGPNLNLVAERLRPGNITGSSDRTFCSCGAGVGIHMGTGGRENARILEYTFHGTILPSPAFLSSCSTNLLTLNGMAPLVFLSSVSGAAKFLYYCLWFSFWLTMDFLRSLIRVHQTLWVSHWGLVVSGTLELVEGSSRVFWVGEWQWLI